MTVRTLRSRAADGTTANAGQATPTRTKIDTASGNPKTQESGTDAKSASKRKTESTAENAAKKQRANISKPRERASAPPKSSSSERTSSATLPMERPAEPHRTNAPLLTPKGSRVVTYTNEDLGKSPSVTGLPRPTSTTSHILEDAYAHLVKVEPRFKALIDKYPCSVFCPESLAEECDPFKALCSSIMAQQVSGAAAASIKRKFIGLFNPTPESEVAAEDLKFPTPAQIAVCTVPFLRQAGLSERKAGYIKGLAEKFDQGELSAAMLVNASDEEVLEKLTAVRGLGRWSVEMFSCFSLKRLDVLSTGDLGVQYARAFHPQIQSNI